MLAICQDYDEHLKVKAVLLDTAALLPTGPAPDIWNSPHRNNYSIIKPEANDTISTNSLTYCKVVLSFL